MKLAVFITILHLSSQQAFDPATFDYCTQACFSQEHVACNCTVLHPREVISTGLDKFRRNILNIHNHWRNFVASGQAEKTSPDAPAASDMLIFNYDLELEHIANCMGSRFDAGPTSCRHTHDGQGVGENLAGSRDRTEESELVKKWYDEIKFLDNTTIDSFEATTRKGTVNHFAQMLWSRSDLLGCARVWNPKIYNSSLRFSLICNYGSTDESGIATIGTSVYKRGRPCSDCPFGTKCESVKFKALCGKSLPIGQTSSRSDFVRGLNQKSVLLADVLVVYFAVIN